MKADLSKYIYVIDMMTHKWVEYVKIELNKPGERSLTIFGLNEKNSREISKNEIVLEENIQYLKLNGMYRAISIGLKNQNSGRGIKLISVELVLKSDKD